MSESWLARRLVGNSSIRNCSQSNLSWFTVRLMDISIPVCGHGAVTGDLGERWLRQLPGVLGEWIVSVAGGTEDRDAVHGAAKSLGTPATRNSRGSYARRL